MQFLLVAAGVEIGSDWMGKPYLGYGSGVDFENLGGKAKA
jgi:hypothetical protein